MKEGQSMANGFTDIAITQIDETRTVLGVPGTSIYHVHLTLSAAPSRKWTEFFNASRSFPRHSMWRKAWISGVYVVVEAPIAEMESYHIRDVKQDMEEANTKYRAYLKREAEEQAQREAAENAERARERRTR
jgi:hypothetical protein